MQKNYLGIKLTNLFRMKTFLIILLGGADILTLLQTNSTFSQDYPCMLDSSGIHDKQCRETLISFQCLSFFFLCFDKLSLLSWCQSCVDNNSIYIEMIDSSIIGDKNVDKVNSLTCYLFNFISIDLVKSTYLPPPPPPPKQCVIMIP